MKNVILRTKRRLGKRLLLGVQSTRMIKSKIILKRQSLDERLGIAIAVENDENNGRVLCVRIEQVEEGSAAQRSGLLPGDAIVRIDGQSVHSCTRIECLRLFADAKLLTELVILPVEIMEAIDKIGSADDGSYKNIQNTNIKKPARKHEGNSRMDRLHRQESLQQQQSSSSLSSSTNLMPSTPSLIFNEEKNNKNSIDQQQPPVARERKSKRFQAGSASSSISFYSSFSNEDDGFDEKRNQNNDNSEIFGRRPFDVYPAVNNNTTTEAINSGDRGRQRQQFCSGQGGREEEKREEEGEGEEVIGTGDDLPSNFKSNEGDFDDPIEQFPSEEGRGGELWSDSSTKQLSFYQPQQSCSDNIKSDVDSTQIFHQDQTNQMSQSNSCNNISSKKLSENDETPATLSSTNISREQQNNKFVSSRQPPQPKSRRRASHFATTSSSINELRERNISTEQKNLFLLQQEKKQQNEQNNGQRRNTTSDLIISSKTTTKENARVLDLIKQFNALDKGELPIPTAQTLSTTINSLNNSSLNCSSPSPTKKEEEEEHLLITKLDFSHIKPQLSPTKFCLSSPPLFKEENLANISISDKTLVEDVKVDTSPPINRSISNLFSSSSPSPPLNKDGGLDQQQQLKPGQYELAIIRGLLSPDEYSKTQIFCVLLLRPAGLKEGSVGLLLSERPLVRSTPEKNCLNYSIEISKVTCGSIAEKSGYLMQGDRV